MEASDVEDSFQASRLASEVTRRSTSRKSSQSRASSSKSDFVVRPFGFEARTSFDATKDLLRSRSDNFVKRPPPKDDDVWKRPAPDFRPQCFAPKPPKRNSREAMQPWKYGTFPGEKKPEKKDNEIKFPQLVPANKEEEEEETFLTKFHIVDPIEAKVDFVREGQFKQAMYRNPMPHDFRGYPCIKQLGLPEFDVNYDQDPFNIHFNSQRLNIIKGLGQDTIEFRDTSGLQMETLLRQPSKWEARLILPTDKFPTRPQNYTRYRRMNRDPHSALMERIDDDLAAKWAKEKWEKQIKSAGL